MAFPFATQSQQGQLKDKIKLIQSIKHEKVLIMRNNLYICTA